MELTINPCAGRFTYENKKIRLPISLVMYDTKLLAFVNSNHRTLMQKKPSSLNVLQTKL